MEELKVTGEVPETRIRRLRMRSWRRGIREMDLILGEFADTRLEGLTEDGIDLYDDLLRENDHDLYRWVSGAGAAPARFSALIDEIARYSRLR